MLRNAVREALRMIGASRVREPLRWLSSHGLLPSAIWHRIPVTGRFRVSAGPASFDYDAPPGDHEARPLFWTGLANYEPETIEEFRLAVAAVPSPVVVDVGANRGIYGLVALADSPDARVVAIEPTAQSADQIAHLADLNGWTHRIQVVRAAATNHEGTVRFEVPSHLFPSAASIEGLGKPSYGDPVLEVAAVTVDGLASHADVVKIDVEGAEHLVLAGMRRLLQESRPVVFLEVLPEGRTKECEALLTDAGYSFFHLTDRGPQACDGLRPDAQRRFRNYLCRPR